MAMIPQLLDVLIIGGGPAGLAVATGLARQLYTAIVFDNAIYRNERATHMHNYLGWDHTPPSVFRAKAREDILARYQTIQFEKTDIVRARRNEKGHFELEDAQGCSWTGGKLVIATGSKDSYPDIPGYQDCWAYGIYACLFCEGYEDRNVQSPGVLAMNHTANLSVALHMSRMAHRLSAHVTIYTNGSEDLAITLRSLLETDKDAKEGRVHVDSRQIVQLNRGKERSSEVIITFADGEIASEGFIVHQPMNQINGPFAQQLGLELTPSGDIKTSQPFGEASMPGVFAVGDCATQMKAVSQAAAMGALAAGGLSFQLGAELATIGN
ncbi:hypothetical protein TrVGV298_008628 [Trichoderma virens]|nr:hypothetical protein TrVGV298_008628 [Trichoderma virens]